VNEWEFGVLEDKTPVESARVDGGAVKKGDRVRLRPSEGGDIFDLALAGQVAVIESIEQDYEGKVHLAVVLEDDPGRDLGVLRQPGHRFFFSPEEVGPVGAEVDSSRVAVHVPSILVAGIGNIFLGDDGFGVEVARRLATFEFPDSVRVRDFGIRGYDLAYALLDGYDLTILVDAAPRGGEAGALYVIEPDIDEGGAEGSGVALDAHAMNPVSVLRLAKSMGPVRGRILLVACEPVSLGGEEGHMGLSDPVAQAVNGAVDVVRDLVEKAQRGELATGASAQGLGK